MNIRIIRRMLPVLTVLFCTAAGAGDKPDITRYDAHYLDHILSISIQWQSANPVTKVMITAGRDQKELKIDEYDNRRNPSGYDGEISTTVAVDPSYQLDPIPFVIQVEDDLRQRSGLVTGKATVPGKGASSGYGGSGYGSSGYGGGFGSGSGYDDGWGRDKLTTQQGGGYYGHDGQGGTGDIINKVVDLMERNDVAPSLGSIAVNIHGGENVSFTTKANDDKGLREIRIRVFDGAGAMVQEQVMTELGKVWQGTSQTFTLRGGNYRVLAQAVDNAGNTSKEQSATFKLAGSKSHLQSRGASPTSSASANQPVYRNQQNRPEYQTGTVQQPEAQGFASGYPAGEPTLEALPTVTDPVIFGNGNFFQVMSGPTSEATFTIDSPYRITFINTAHYLNNGTPPGSIALRHSDGTVYGPWACSGAVGDDGARNAFWFVQPYADIKPGTYTVIDSDPGTWSYNEGSAGAGFVQIMGVQLVQ